MEESMERENATPVAAGAKAGAILAAINIAITVIMYVADPAAMANWWLGLLILVLNLVLVVVFGIKYRNSVGGYLAFGKAYIHGFVALAVSGFIVILFNILLYTVIDPDLVGVITEASIEKTAEFMQNMGAPSESIDEAIAQMEKDMPGRFTLSGFLTQYGIGLIIYAVVALITALIVKKNEPIADM